MRTRKWQWMMLVAGVAVACNALADGPQNAKEQQLVERLQAAYKARGLTLTPEREEAMLQQYRQMQERAADAQAMSEAPGLTPAQRVHLALSAMQPTGQAAPPSSTGVMAARAATATKLEVAAPPSAVANASSSPAAALVAAVNERHAQGKPTTFEWRPDGFMANGKSVIDPEGRIVQWGGDSRTGDVSYLVQTEPGKYDVRFTNTNSALPPITVGTMIVDRAGDHFTATDGQTVSGQIPIPTSKGIVMARDTAVFDYEYGQPVISQALPAQYMLATYQRGAVGATNYVLLKRYVSEAERHNPIEGIKGLFKIAQGKATSDDFALFNVKTGHVVYLANDEAGTGGSIWNTDGRPNYQHYFWLFDWLPNPKGATAVVLEDGFKNLNAIRLDKDERITIAHRALGIERFSVYPLANGSFGVADSGTKLGLSMKDEQVDINTLFQKHEAGAAKASDASAAAPAS